MTSFCQRAHNFNDYAFVVHGSLTLFSAVSGSSHFGRWLAASMSRNSPSVSKTLEWIFFVKFKWLIMKLSKLQNVCYSYVCNTAGQIWTSCYKTAKWIPETILITGSWRYDKSSWTYFATSPLKARVSCCNRNTMNHSSSTLSPNSVLP